MEIASNHLENRQRQHRLREESDGEGQRAEHRQAQRIDDQMREAGPEIDRRGINGPFGGIVDLRQDQYQRREDDEVFHRVVMREHQPRGPLRMRLGVARWIGHRPGQATNLAAIQYIGDPQQSGENDRQRQPEQFGRQQCGRHRFPLNRFRIASRRGRPFIMKAATVRYARTRTYLPGASSIGGSASVPTARARTSSASMLVSHSRQFGHHEPLCSCAPLSQSASVTSLILSLVQYWYLSDDGWLTTHAICPDPDTTYFTGP